MFDETTADLGREPRYHPSLDNVFTELNGLNALSARDPNPAKPMEGFRRWKMRNLLARWAAAQAAGRHELAVTAITDGIYDWVCTCGLLVPATRARFNEAAFLAAPGHRALPSAPSWYASTDAEPDDSTTTDDSNTNTSTPNTKQGEL